MEDKQELKDILIDENENKAAASKKILLFSAAGLLVFIFAIFIVYALSGGGDESNEQQTSAVPTEEVVAEESVTTEEVIPEPMNEETNFQQVPIENAPESDNEDRFDKMIQEIKDKNLPEPPKEPSATPKEPVKTPTKTETKKDAPQKTASSSGANVPQGYYLQVGANIKYDPDKKFLQKISDSGFSYKLQRLNRDGKEIIRTLIGPYSSRSAAKADLDKAKKSINSNAFVYEVK